MRRGFRTGVTIAASLAVALLAAGCGSDDGDSSTTATPAGASTGTTTTAAAPAGETIVLGNIGTYSGPIGSGNQTNRPLIEHWLKQVNGAGGINGHPVKVIAQDDAADPNKALTLAKTQVENDKVIGFVSNKWPVTVDAVAPYLLEQGVPVVGGESSTQVWYENPMLFPVNSDTKVMSTALGRAAKAAGVKKVSIMVCDKGAACTGTRDLIKAGLTESSVPVTNEQKFALAAPSFQANCLAAQKAGADALYPIGDPATFTRVMKSCARIGYKPKFLFIQSNISNSFLDVSGGIEGFGPSVAFPFFLTSGSPALEEYGAAIKDLPSEALGPTTATTWASLKVLEAALKAGVKDGEKPSTAGLLKGLYSLKGETAGGLTAPLTYTEGKPAPGGDCWFDVTLKDQKFSTPSGGLEPTCR